MTESGPDWLAFLKSRNPVETLDLETLREGDVLFVETEHTNYRLEVRDAETRRLRVTSDRDDRPEREMQLMGCTFGESSSIAPDKLFCGGNLQMSWTSDEGVHTFTTTEIRKLVHITKK